MASLTRLFFSFVRRWQRLPLCVGFAVCWGICSFFGTSSRAALAWCEFFLVLQSPEGRKSFCLFTCWVRSLPLHPPSYFTLVIGRTLPILLPWALAWKRKKPLYTVQNLLGWLQVGRDIPNHAKEEGTGDSAFWCWPLFRNQDLQWGRDFIHFNKVFILKVSPHFFPYKMSNYNVLGCGWRRIAPYVLWCSQTTRVENN